MSTTATTATIETITPEVAAVYLASRGRNRNVNARHVARLATDMSNGNWVVTGEAIKFDSHVLIDGQHRLEACVMSETPFTTLVVRGLPTESCKAMDSGMKRSVSDALRMFGNMEIPNPNVVAGAARVVLCVERRPDNPHAVYAELTHSEMVLEIEANVDVYVAAGRFGQAMFRWGSPSEAAALYVLARRAGYSEELLDHYATNIITGAGLPPSHPCLTFRNWIANRPRRTYHRKFGLLSLHVKAFDAYAHGRSLGKLFVWTGKSPFPMLEPATRPQP
jgi:hypothetical protein